MNKLRQGYVQGVVYYYLRGFGISRLANKGENVEETDDDDQRKIEVTYESTTKLCRRGK